MPQSNDEIIMIDPTWLYHLFTRIFDHWRFPSLSRKAIGQRLTRRKASGLKRKKKKKLMPLRPKFTSTEFNSRRELCIAAAQYKSKMVKERKAAEANKVLVKPKDRNRKRINAERPNDYCGVLRMEDLHKLGRVNLCYAEI